MIKRGFGSTAPTATAPSSTPMSANLEAYILDAQTALALGESTFTSSQIQTIQTYNQSTHTETSTPQGYTFQSGSTVDNFSVSVNGTNLSTEFFHGLTSCQNFPEYLTDSQGNLWLYEIIECPNQPMVYTFKLLGSNSSSTLVNIAEGNSTPPITGSVLDTTDAPPPAPLPESFFDTNGVYIIAGGTVLVLLLILFWPKSEHSKTDVENSSPQPIVSPTPSSSPLEMDVA